MRETFSFYYLHDYSTVYSLHIKLYTRSINLCPIISSRIFTKNVQCCVHIFSSVLANIFTNMYDNISLHLLAL